MNNKEKIIKIVIVAFLVIILSVIIVIVLIKSNDKQLNDIKGEQEIESNNEKYNGKVTCIKQVTTESTIELYNLKEVIVENGLAKEGNSLYKIIYKDKDMYEGFKENEKLENPIYDDKNLTIIYDNEGKQDLANYNIEYENIITNLEKNGFTCK